MSLTFGEAWRRVSLHVPLAPPTLVQHWVQTVYNRVLETRPWGMLRKQGTIATETMRTVACVTTLDSATVTAAPGTFLATDVDKQFRVSSYPLYTISAVAAGGASCTLDQQFSDTTAIGAVNAFILTAYFTAPTDFGKFLLVADPYNQRRIPFWITEEQLNILDPIRRASDPSPRMLVAYRFSLTVASAGQPVYELWPYCTAQRRYPYLYYRRPDVLVDETPFTGVFAQRPDLFTTGALAEAARWPGTAEVRNGYFNLQLSTELMKQFVQDLQYLSVQDDNMYMVDYETVNWSRWPLAGGYDTHLLRSTDADINNYWAL